MAVNLNIPPWVYLRTKNNHPVGRSGGLCYLCNSQIHVTEKLLCSECVLDLPLNDSACPFCAMPTQDGLACAGCVRPRKQWIHKIFCAYQYEHPVSRLIQHMKFNSRLDITDFLGRKMAGLAAQQGIVLPDCFIPVPLHTSRLRVRGFNQSLELARSVARITGRPVEYKICGRAQNTAAQTGLSAKQRRRNVNKAFVINKKAFRQYQHVAIIDDVVTTGSTAHELASVLGRAGIVNIDVWACARAAFI